jgi:SAM-dependent methyltransferase
MSSWYDAWADRYAEWSTGVTADVPFYVELARETNGLLVELAVGNGRVAIPVAQATGRRVVGIDSSPAMLAQARVRAVEEGVELDLREGDIGSLKSRNRRLDLLPRAVSAASAHVGGRRRCFERVAASLRPNGRFAWNAFAFDHQIASAIDGRQADTPLPHTIHYSVSDNRVDITLDGGGTGHSGGQPRTNGWGSSTSRACGWKLSTADSPANRSTTTAQSTSSWPDAKRSTWP